MKLQPTIHGGYHRAIRKTSKCCRYRHILRLVLSLEIAQLSCTCKDSTVSTTPQFRVLQRLYGIHLDRRGLIFESHGFLS